MNKRNYNKYKSSGNRTCDICNQKEILIEHHIEGREGKLFNRNSNKCLICANCHYKVHNGIIIIEYWTTSSTGRELLWHYKNEESLTGYDSKPPLFNES